MRNHKLKQELLRDLHKIAESVRTEDVRFLEGVQKCPSAREACAMLVDALAAPSLHHREEHLLPPASWIHPVI